MNDAFAVWRRNFRVYLRLWKTELIAPQRLELTRDYSYDETAVLAKQREEAVLRAALARDLAGIVLRQIAAL